MIYRITHLTEYFYDQPVSSSHHELHLLLRSTDRQRCFFEELSVVPDPAVRRDWVDTFGNRCTHLEIWEPHRRLEVISRADVEITPWAGPRDLGGVSWETVRAGVLHPKSAAFLDAAAYAFESPYVTIVPEAAAFAAPSFPAGRPLLEAVSDLTRRIHTDFTYDPRATTTSTPVSEVLANHRGVCQDFAHLQIACLRALGLPARYVSGYLSTSPPPGKPRLVGADASHAWLAVYAPDAGWVEFDPTNDVIPDDKHITLAWGRDFGDVTPLRGVVMGGGAHGLRVSVDVLPQGEPEPAPEPAADSGSGPMTSGSSQ